LAFSRSIAVGELIVEPVLDSEWQRIAALCEQYVELPLGIVDASIVALAERHGADTVATLDHRHFGTVRPRHVNGSRLSRRSRTASIASGAARGPAPSGTHGGPGS
jgi:uncharacterized protein